MKSRLIKADLMSKQVTSLKTALQQGFTLIELIMVMSIVAILASVAVPSFSSMNAAQEVAGVAQTIQQHLLYARSEAIKQNADIHLSFTTGTNWCMGYSDNGACTCSTVSSCEINTKDLDPSTDIEKRISANDYSNITLTTSGTLNLSGANFNPTRGAVLRSGAALNDGSITVTSGSNAATININVLGRPNICSSSLSQFSNC